MPSTRMFRRSLAAIVGLLIVSPMMGASLRAQFPGMQQMTPEQRAAMQQRMAEMRAASAADRQAMMVRLGLHDPDSLPPVATDPNRPPNLTQHQGSTNWYDADGNTYVRSEWGNWSNYDEAHAGNYTLPDPLKLNDGQPVTNAAMWWNQRRPEILNAYLTEIYGRIPANTPKVTFEVTKVDSTTFPGQAIVKTVTGHVDNSRYPAATPSVDLTVYEPAHATGKVPVIVTVGGFFARPGQLPSQVSQVLALGWAAASVNTNSIQADNGAGLTTGIIGLMNEGKPRQPDDWGVLAAWSWGMSRALDYLETDPAIDATRAAVQGHSRWGKEALIAAAFDQRWAIAWPSCAGAMGSSLEKRAWGETIDNVAGSGEYHWMAGNFLKYGGHWDRMPVDAHELIALVAPRPVFVTGGTKDQWSDPHGEFLAAVGADPVYRLLGARGLGTTTMPAPDVSVIDGDLAFRDHDGGHTDVPDWPTFLQFAQKYFGKGAVSAGK